MGVMDEKKRIAWKGSYKAENAQNHKRRFVFLMELFLACVREKDFILFDRYRPVTDYIGLAKSISKESGIDGNFLDEGFDFRSKEYRTALADRYFGCIFPRREPLLKWAGILGSLSPLLIIAGITYFLSWSDFFLWLLCLGINFLACAVMFKRFYDGKFRPNWFVFSVVVKSNVILENLEAELREIEAAETLAKIRQEIYR